MDAVPPHAAAAVGTPAVRRSLHPLLGLLLAALIIPTSARGQSFEALVIDPDLAGDCKLVGDIDGDGQPDLIVGGSPGENLNWLRYPDWLKTTIAVPAVEFTTDAALGDVDGDGDLDIVVPDGPTGENLLWFENPRPTADPTDGAAWTRHVIGSLGDWGKDVELADFDRDDRLDVATRTRTAAFVFFQDGGDDWQRVQIAAGLTGEGMASGDIDADGDCDLVLAGWWLENPCPADPRSQSWAGYTITDGLYDQFKAVVTDVDLDGTADVLFSCSEATGDVAWYEPAAGDPHGVWQRHLLVADLDRCHTLQVGDFDRDGTRDVLVGQMHTSADRELRIYYNLDGNGTQWQSQLVDTTGIHNGVVADIDSDGDCDIFGCNYTGNPPLRLWINHVRDCSPGDIDGNGRVDLADLALLLRSYGNAAGQEGYNHVADLDCDDRVDIRDLARLLADYGSSCARQGPACENSD